MADINPYRGVPAYANAVNTEQCVESPCELSVPPEPVIQDEEEEVVVVRPDCVAIVFASDSEEILQTLNYIEVSDRYISDDGTLMTFDTNMGWLLQTGNSNYRPENPSSTSPFGQYNSIRGDVISVSSCVGVMFTPPPITFAECVDVVYYSDTSEVIQQFTYDLTIARYTATNGDTISLNDDGVWELTTSNRIYTATSESEQAFGAYCNDLDDEAASVIPCNKGSQIFTLSVCVELVFTHDSRIPLGQFTLNGSGEYETVGNSQGELAFVNGDGWTYNIEVPVGNDPAVTENLVYSGGTNPNVAHGLFTDIFGNNILINNCG